MSLTKLSSSIIGSNVINNTHIADGSILTRHFDTNAVPPSVNANIYNTYQNLTANDFNTLTTARANDWGTLVNARSNDWTTYLSSQSNDWATYNQVSWTIKDEGNNVYTDPKTVNFTGVGVTVTNVGNAVTVALSAGGDGTISNEYNTYLSALANDYSTYTNLSSSILQPKYNSNISTGTSNCFFVRVGATSPADVSKVYVSLNGIQQINGFDYIYNSGNDTIQFTDSSIPADLNVHIMAFTT